MYRKGGPSVCVVKLKPDQAILALCMGLRTRGSVGTHWGCGIFGSISTGNESYEEVMAAVVEKFGSVIPVEILRKIEELYPREVVCRQCASRYNPARWLPAHCPDCGHSLERG